MDNVDAQASAVENVCGFILPRVLKKNMKVTNSRSSPCEAAGFSPYGNADDRDDSRKKYARLTKPMKKNILNLHFADGVTIRDVADEYALPYRTVQSIVRRFRARLRKFVIRMSSDDVDTESVKAGSESGEDDGSVDGGSSVKVNDKDVDWSKVPLSRAVMEGNSVEDDLKLYNCAMMLVHSTPHGLGVYRCMCDSLFGLGAAFPSSGSRSRIPADADAVRGGLSSALRMGGMFAERSGSEPISPPGPVVSYLPSMPPTYGAWLPPPSAMGLPMPHNVRVADSPGAPCSFPYGGQQFMPYGAAAFQLGARPVGPAMY